MNYKGSGITLLLFFVSLSVMLRQLLTNGFYSCVVTDSFTYSSWAWQFKEALGEGILYPRWMPRNYWGYGSPTFILYPPLAFYITSFFSLLTDSFILAMNLTKLAAVFISGIGMHYLVRELYDEKSALCSAIFYIILPYYVLQYYALGGYASAISFMWFAPILSFAYKYLSARQLRYGLYAGLCYAGLILTHLINAYMFTFVMIIFVTAISIENKRPLDIFSVPIIMITGFLVSAIYIVPLSAEKKFLQLAAFISEKRGFVFSDYFIFPFTPNFTPSNIFWLKFHDTFVTHTLLLSIMILFVSYMTFRCRGSDSTHVVRDRKFTLLLFLCVLSIFLLFGASSFIWRTIPLFAYIQFPVRWLHITIFTVPVLLGACLNRLQSSGRSGKTFVSTVVALFLICSIFDLGIISRACSFDHGELFPVKDVNFSTEHMPKSVRIELLDNRDDQEPARVIRGKGDAKIAVWKSTERIVDVHAVQNVVARVRTFNFPGWSAYLDGVPAAIKSETGTDAILVDVPAGNHRVYLVFQDTPVRKAGKFISLISFIAVISILIVSKF